MLRTYNQMNAHVFIGKVQFITLPQPQVVRFFLMFFCLEVSSSRWFRKMQYQLQL